MEPNEIQDILAAHGASSFSLLLSRVQELSLTVKGFFLHLLYYLLSSLELITLKLRVE